MRYVLIWGFLAALAGGAGFPGGVYADRGKQPQALGMGTLTGSVTLGPVSPVQRPGGPPAGIPAAGVKLLILSPTRQEIASVTTNAAGQFRVDLPAGTYRVEMVPRKGKEFTKDLPAIVTIIPGQEQRLDIRLDTGMR